MRSIVIVFLLIVISKLLVLAAPLIGNDLADAQRRHEKVNEKRAIEEAIGKQGPS